MVERFQDKWLEILGNQAVERGGTQSNRPYGPVADQPDAVPTMGMSYQSYYQQIGAGSNPWGSLGRQKCQSCRDRRKKVSNILQTLIDTPLKCEFDESNPHLPCVYCQKHGQHTCEKVFSPSRQAQGNLNNIPSPPSEPSEFRLSEICAYYEQLYSSAAPEQIIAYLTKHVTDQQLRDAQEEQAIAQSIAAAQQSPYGQTAMVVPGQQPQDAGYFTAGPSVGQYQQGYGTGQSQQYAVVEPSLLQSQQSGTYYPQQQYHSYWDSF